MSSPWKCPHCGTPQAEAARCWACKRSPLACSTCRDFRRSVAGKLGYCGKDKARAVLTGDEVRPCWTAPDLAEEPPLLGLFGALEPAAPAPKPARPRRVRVEVPTVPPTVPGDRPAPDAGTAAHPVVTLGPDDAPVSIHPAPPPRDPAPIAAVAARRRWDALMADVAAGAPLGSDPAGGATPSVSHRPAPGSTPIVPWLANAPRATDLARAVDPPHVAAPTAAATATPPSGTPITVPQTTPRSSPAALPPGAETTAFAAWAASEPAVVADPPAPTSAVRPWSSPTPGRSTWAHSADDVTPTEAIRWRHRAVDEPAPLVDTPDTAAPRRPTNLSLIPATLANRLRRHLGTRGPRTDIAALPVTPPPDTSSLTSPSVRGATPISTSRAAPYGRLVEAPPVSGTIMSLGDQLRRAEQLRRERALLDAEALGGERRLEPPA